MALRVLVVDDHDMLRSCVVALLEAEPDIEVVGEAASGEWAIEMAERLHPDVVLLDYRMPGMNGIETTRCIHKRLPDIAIVDYSMNEAGDWLGIVMADAGAAAFVPKSASPEHLADVLRLAYARR